MTAERELTIADVEISRSGGSFGNVQGMDIYLGHDVTLLLASLDENGDGVGVWGVKIGERVYREPRDLTPEPLGHGPLRDVVEQAVAASGGGYTSPPPRTPEPAEGVSGEARYPA